MVADEMISQVGLGPIKLVLCLTARTVVAQLDKADIPLLFNLLSVSSQSRCSRAVNRLYRLN